MISFPELEEKITAVFTTPHTDAALEEIEWVESPIGLQITAWLRVLEETPPTPPYEFVLNDVIGRKIDLQRVLSDYGCTMQMGSGKLEKVVLESNALGKQPVRWLLSWQIMLAVPHY
jgi:hypothetical protein